MNLNIIIGNRSERIPRLMDQLESQGIEDYEFWEGVYKHDSAIMNISAAHKQIVEYAMLAGFPEVTIAEDDIRFFKKGAWDYYRQSKPEDFDIWLGGIYMGDIKEDHTVDYFCGFHLYTVHQRFYEKFLSVDKHEHIDRGLKGLGKFVVCNPMVADQFNGWSSNTGKDEVYENLLQGRNLFGV